MKQNRDRTYPFCPLACEHVDVTQVGKELCFISSNERSLSSCDVSNSSLVKNTASYVSHKHMFT